MAYLHVSAGASLVHAFVFESIRALCALSDFNADCSLTAGVAFIVILSMAPGHVVATPITGAQRRLGRAR
jgi:hypothetical protein